MSPEQTALQQSIERLYEVFSRYPLADHVEGCPCCTHEHDHYLIHSKPLRDLMVADLDRFAMKALTTWGGEDDLKHFLPRLLELLVTNRNEFTLEEALVGKLTYAKPPWQEWPDTERDAIDTFFKALWVSALLHPDYPTAEYWLWLLAHAYEDLTPFLQLWSANAQSEGALAQLAYFYYDNASALQQGHLAGWLKESPTETQVLEWARHPQTRLMLKNGLPRVRHLPWLVDQGVIQEWIDWILEIDSTI